MQLGIQDVCVYCTVLCYILYEERFATFIVHPVHIQCMYGDGFLSYDSSKSWREKDRNYKKRSQFKFGFTIHA